MKKNRVQHYIRGLGLSTLMVSIVVIWSLFAGLSAHCETIPARSISVVPTNGITATRLQDALRDFDSAISNLNKAIVLVSNTTAQIRIELVASSNSLSSDILGRINGINGIATNLTAHGLTIVGGMTLGGVTRTAWIDPSSGVTKEDGDTYWAARNDAFFNYFVLSGSKMMFGPNIVTNVDDSITCIILGQQPNDIISKAGLVSINPSTSIPYIEAGGIGIGAYGYAGGISIGAGTATYMDSNIAIGNGAHSDNIQNTVAIGSGAQTLAENTVQFGTGDNSNPGTVQFFDWGSISNAHWTILKNLIVSGTNLYWVNGTATNKLN